MKETQFPRPRARKIQFWPPIILLLLLLLAVDSFLFATNTTSLVVEVKKIAPEKKRMILMAEKDLNAKVGQTLSVSSQCEMRVEQAARKEILVNYSKCPAAKDFSAGNKIFMNIETK
jgi:hypothetical protein